MLDNDDILPPITIKGIHAMQTKASFQLAVKAMMIPAPMPTAHCTMIATLEPVEKNSFKVSNQNVFKLQKFIWLTTRA